MTTQTRQANGEVIKALREANGWGTREFATIAGISHSYVSNIEAGRKKAPRPPVLKKIATALGVSISTITFWCHVEHETH